MNTAPVIVTVYDRLEHLKECIDALRGNQLSAASELYLVSDAAASAEDKKRIEAVRHYAGSISGFRKVHLVFRKENLGAFRSFLAITREVANEHGKFIFLEDDVIAAPNLLSYLNYGLEYYEDRKAIFSIASYTLPIVFPPSFKGDVFFLPSNCPWGFATWRDRWSVVDFDRRDRYSEALRDRLLYKKLVSTGDYMVDVLRSDSMGLINAPDVRVAYHQFLCNLYSVYPRVSKTMNIGLDGSGLHSGKDSKNKYLVKIDRSFSDVVFDQNISLRADILKRVRDYQNGGLWLRLRRYLSTMKHRCFPKGCVRDHGQLTV